MNNNPDYKQKLFCNRIDNYVLIPDEIKNKLTESFVNSSSYLLPSEENNINSEKQLLIEEISLIIDELEIFEREKRKKKLILLMEKIAGCLDEDAITEEELTDRLFYGNKVCSIEKEFLKKRKGQSVNNYFNNQMCAKLNNILEDDNKVSVITKKKYKLILGSKLRCNSCGMPTIKDKYRCRDCGITYHSLCVRSKKIDGRRMCSKCIIKLIL